MNPEQLDGLHTVIGRVNALHTFCVVLARSLPPSTAPAVAANLQNAIQRVEADAVASPVPDAHLNELLRVLAQLQHCVQQSQNP